MTLEQIPPKANQERIDVPSLAETADLHRTYAAASDEVKGSVDKTKQLFDEVRDRHKK